MSTEQFKMWAMVELFGHTRVAGEVSEQTIAGGAMVRIDVPDTGKSPAFTRIVNVSAIYAINPMSEEMVRSIASQLNVTPITSWDIRDYIDKNKTSLLAANNQSDDDIF
jgi:hypothetical protein